MKAAPGKRAALAAAATALACAALGVREARAGEPASVAAATAAPSKDDLARAQKLFEEGKRELDAGRAADALAKFRAVTAIKVTPGVLFHVAHALEDLGKLVEALATFEASERLAREQGVGDVLALSGARVAPLRARVPTVEVRVRGARRADVRARARGAPREDAVDEAGALAVRLDVGKHVLELTLDGAVVATRELELGVGARERWDVDLDAKPEAAAAKVSLAPTRPATATATAKKRPAAATPRRLRLESIVAGAGALAFAGAGAALVAVSAAKNSSAAEACAAARGCDLDAAGSVHLYDRLALTAFAVAAASAGVAVVLHVTQAPAGQTSQARQARGTSRATRTSPRRPALTLGARLGPLELRAFARF